jgi:ATP-dependent Lon protease
VNEKFRRVFGGKVVNKYRNISYYSHVLSGGKATPAGLFINNATGKVGVVGTRDAVVFDEIANTDFTDPKALVSMGRTGE